MIRYILDKKLYQKEYVMNYTNATFLIDPSYKFDVADGLFSGWDEKEKAYSNKTWMYQTEKVIPWNTEPSAPGAWVDNPGVPSSTIRHSRYLRKMLPCRIQTAF